jgi:hypothetical protein
MLPKDTYSHRCAATLLSASHIESNSFVLARKGGTRLRREHESTSLQGRIEVADKQINELVYEWYELTEEGLRIV